MCKLGVISQERLKIEVKLLLSANRKSYMPRRLAQQRKTLSDLEWPLHGFASHAVFAVVELLVSLMSSIKLCCLSFARNHECGRCENGMDLQLCESSSSS